MAISRQVLGKVSSFLRQEGRSIWGEKLEKQYLLITEKRFQRIQRNGIKGDQWRWGWEQSHFQVKVPPSRIQRVCSKVSLHFLASLRIYSHQGVRICGFLGGHSVPNYYILSVPEIPQYKSINLFTNASGIIISNVGVQIR